MAKKVEKDATGLQTMLCTEDGVPVYTLYLGNIPRQKNEGIIRNYFSKFGEVRSVVIIKKPKNTRNESTTFQYGFVTFEKPEFAAAALKTNHPSISKRLKVRAADTWKQPLQRPPNIEFDKYTDNTSEDTTSILDLNVDCLLHIFSYLNSVERLKLALISQRFNTVAEHLIKVNKEFDFSDMCTNFTLMETRKILSQFGPYMKKIHLQGSPEMIYRRYLEFVPNYCQHLVELDFESLRNIHFETYQRVFLSAKNIKSLKLGNCDINNRICSLFVHLTQLECLNLSHNCDVTGKYLNKLKNIIDLNLSNCENLGSKHFIDVCKSMHLKVLNIVGCYQLNDDSFRHLVETQPNLERVMVSNSYQASHVGVIGKLNSLKHIRIHREGGAYFSTDILTEVAQHRKDDLESLEIYHLLVTIEDLNRERILEFKNLKKLCLVRDKYLDSAFLLEISQNCKQLEEINIAGSTSVTEDGVIGAMKNLIQLRKLNISFCEQFKDNLYHQIVKVLRDRKSSNLLTMCVPETGINQSLAKSNKYKINENIVALTFETDPYYAEHYDPDDDYSDYSFNDDFDYFNNTDTDDDDYIDDFFYDSDEVPIYLL